MEKKERASVLSKKLLGVLLVIAVIVSAVGVGLTTYDKSFKTPQSHAIDEFNASTYRRPSPNVTIDATDVIRVGSSDATMGPGNSIKKATASGVPEISGTYASHALAGETAYWPTISFASSANVNITEISLSGSGINAAPTLTSGSLTNTTAATWEIRSGTAEAGGLVKIAITYTYTWNNTYTGVNVTDTYTTNAYSYVENIIFPAGVWAFTAAGSSNSNKADVPYISRILGRGVYGELLNFSSTSGDYQSGYVDFSTGDYFTAVSASNFTRVMLKSDPPSPGTGDRTIANGTDTYASGDPHRGKAVIYREADSSLEDNNVRMHFFIHKSSRSGVNLTWETIHTRDGDTTYQGSTGNDLGSSGTASWTALAPTGPKDGTVSDNGPYSGFITAGMQITSNFQGTGAAGTYTMINQWTGKGKAEGVPSKTNWMQYYVAQTIQIIVLNRSTLRTNLNKIIGITQKTVTDANKVVTVVTANGSDPTSGGITNTNKGKNPQEWYYSANWSGYVTAYENMWLHAQKPNTTQANIDSVATAGNTAYANLTLRGANYSQATGASLVIGLGNTYNGSTVKPLNTSLTAIANGDGTYNSKLTDWKQNQNYFTVESKNALNAAITAANNAKNANYNVLYQPYVDHCAKELQLAVENLEYKQNTVTFDSNTGAGYMAPQTIQAGSSAILYSNTFSKTGHIFTGWNTQADGSGTAYANGANFNMGADSVTLYAQWQNNSFTISFNSNGGTAVATVTKDYGTQIAAPTAPAKTGYAFAGWYTDSGLNTAVSWPHTVVADATFYAKWTVKSYIITFNANGGNGSMGNQSVDFGATVTLSENNYSRTGYSFAGWNTQADGNGTAYADKASYGPMGTANVTLYAQWAPKQYTITFNTAGGSSVAPITQAYGSAVTPPAAPTRPGYVFGGWYPQVPAFMPAEDLVCVAQWEANQHTISFMTNGGTSIDPITDKDSTEVSAPTAPTRDGYTFAGWFADEELAQAVSWPHTIAANVTFYAKWTPNTYTVNYNGNGSDSGSTLSSQHTYNVTDALAQNGFSKAGYSFAGWNTAADGSGTEYYDQQLVMNLSQADGSSVTLFAQWTPNNYTVAFHSMGGSDVDPITDVVGTQISEPSQPTRTGYDFAGWYADAQFSQAVAWPYTIGSSNVVFYAKWDLVNEYTVTFDANGGEGGASVEVRHGEMPVPPTVRRVGYAFTGWTPALTEATQDATYTAQWVKTSIEVKATEDNMIAVQITGYSDDYSYQIWSYQKITSDLILDDESNVPVNQWVLSMPYQKGSMGTVKDGKLTFEIGKFTSPNENYTIALRIADENGDYIFELRDSYTPDDLDIAVITKILVDGEYVKGSAQNDGDGHSNNFVVKEIKTGAQVTIKVLGNLQGLDYTATVEETGDELTATNGNEFVWNISILQPHRYNVKVTASNGNSHDSRTVHFTLYQLSGAEYAEIDSLDITGGNLNLVPQNIGITADFTNNIGVFFYKISEPGRKAQISSGTHSTLNTVSQEIGKFGYYQLTGLVNRVDGIQNPTGYDDGIIKFFNIRRSNAPSSIVVETKVNGSAVNPANPINKGDAIRVEGTADIAGIGSTPVQYSFWRYDAKGYVLVKDWSFDNFLDWTPGKVGNYNIEVRAKGEDAGSYEVHKSIALSIVDPDESIAQGVQITINADELNANAQARVPIVIRASASSTNGQDLLYKFYVYDEFMKTRTLQNYSANQECLWTPRKAGTYEIMVLVKNQVSYGKYDAIKKVTVTVD